MAATSPHSGWACEEQRIDARTLTTSEAAAPASSATLPEPSLVPVTAGAPTSWGARLEDPFNRYYRSPLARLIVRVLLKANVPPHRLTVAQPLLAALAGYFVMFADAKNLALGAGLFELRSILARVEDTFGRSKAATEPACSAIPGMADRLSVFFLYAGIFWHFHLHPPPSGAWSQYISVNGVLLLALLQGAIRSFAADYYRRKYTSIFEHGHDETVSALRREVLTRGPNAPIFAHIDVFIGRIGHLCFEQEWFDPQRSPSPRSDESIQQLIRQRSSPAARIIGFLWGISNGEAFLSLVVLTLVMDQLWAGQLFFASAGVAWILGVILLNGWFIRSASRLSHPLPAPSLRNP
jgi:hypothetical protein